MSANAGADNKLSYKQVKTWKERSMKAITATPASIKEVFQKDYLIPNFQRPYSWGEDECEKLWNDILDFYESKESKTEKYFLGNIVVYASQDADIQKIEVVDGQQRLITLTLLIKALFDYAKTWTTLEKCLKMTDPKTNEVTNELRVKTQVIANDMKALEDVILNQPCDEKTKKTNIFLNFTNYKSKVDEWSKNKTATEYDQFVTTLLDQIVLLPINCETTDDALTIFETINNRGKPLDDSDIFKAKLYDAAKDKDWFMKRWNEITKHDWIFRIYMHVLRAKKGYADRGYIDKEIALRKFFDTEGSKSIKDCEGTMHALRIIHKIDTEFEGDSHILSLWKILYTYPNQYWNFPLYVYLHKYGKLENGELKLQSKRFDEFKFIIEETVKYFFLKGVIGHGYSNIVKEVVYKVYSKIEAGKDFLVEYKNGITQADKQEFNARVDESRFGRCSKGIILISAYLNPNQDLGKFTEMLGGKYDIEHILPRVWNNYDGWNEKSHGEDINLLGNLMPLGRRLNIKASNEYFARKKAEYAKSGVQDALDLTKIAIWTRQTLKDRNNVKVKLLKEFFGAI